MLAIEVNGAYILGAVVVKRGNRVRVSNFVSLDRANPTDDIPDPANIQEIVQRLGYSDRAVVFITPLARSVQISMNRPKVEKLRQYQLEDALRWEVEPYTGIAGSQAIVGAERGSPVENEELMILTEDEEELDVNVSVIEQNVYRAMKQIFKRTGLRLVRIYPPEACFYMPLFMEKVEGAQAVFDVGADYASFTIVKGNSPKQINTVPLGKEVLHELVESGEANDARQSLEFLLKQVPGPLPMIVTGLGATDPAIVAFLDKLCEPGARPLMLSRESRIAGAEHDTMNAMFGVVAGAAIRELQGRKFQLIGITDVIPLPVKIRQSGHVLPLVATVALALGLFGHYEYMKISREKYSDRTAELSKELQKRQQTQAVYDGLQTELTDLKKDISNRRKQIDFLQRGSDSGLDHIVQVLRSFYLLPQSILLDSVIQDDNNRYTLVGRAVDMQDVGKFAVRLQGFAWCRAVHIKEMAFDNQKQFNFSLEMETTPVDRDMKESP